MASLERLRRARRRREHESSRWSPLTGYALRIRFSDGSSRDVDLGSELSAPVFEPLRELELFRRGHGRPELGTVVWPNGADLDPDVLHGGQTPAETAAEPWARAETMP